MSEHPYFRTDIFRPPHGVNVISPEEERSAAAAASREATEREMDYLKALGRPRLAQPELPPIKEPVLPDDFAQQVARLDDEIFARGIAIDADKLGELGKELFAALLAADRKARAHQRVVDLTRWESVQTGLCAFAATAVQPRKMREQVAGTGKERDAVRQIAGFDDLWKFTSERQEVVQDIYAFHDAFESLRFGHDMLEGRSKDGRVRSRFFCGGAGRKVDLFCDWLNVAENPLTGVKLVAPLWSLLAWLGGEQAPPPSPVDLARDFFAVRAPSPLQVRVAEAVLHGFLLDYRDWPLWQYVGRKTRAAPDQGQLAAWRTALARRYLGITSFHAELSAAFFKDVGHGWDSHRQFEPARHRPFFDGMVQKSLDVAAALLALGIEQTCKGAVLARFQGHVLVDAEHKLKDKRAQIGLPLAKAFPAASFRLEFTEVKS